MPRGVYPRKKKGEAAQAPAPTKTKLKAAPKLKAEPKMKELPLGMMHQVPLEDAGFPAGFGSASLRRAEGAFQFNLLGNNLTTLSQTFLNSASNEVIADRVGKEIRETVETMAALRRDLFKDVLNKQVVVVLAEPESLEHPVADLEKEELPPTVAAPVMPTLPQGNSSFTPPAPPIPHH